jgi:hypothetical protein
VEELINQLKQKAGLDHCNAEQISALVQKNAANLPQLLGGDNQGLTQMLQKAGIDPAVIQKAVTFLQQNAANLPAMLESEGGGLLKKAKDLVGSVFGGKESQ